MSRSYWLTGGSRLSNDWMLAQSGKMNRYRIGYTAPGPSMLAEGPLKDGFMAELAMNTRVQSSFCYCRLVAPISIRTGRIFHGELPFEEEECPS